MQMTEIEEQQENLRQLRQQLSVVESLKQQLVSQREEHEAAAHRLKMEASWAIEKTIERSRNREDNCVRTEVSNILQGERTQHRKMLEMLQFLQSEKVQLQKENDILRDRGRELQVRSDDLKKDLNKINQASFVPKEEVEQLRKKCQQQTEEQKQCSTAHQHTLAQIEALRQRLASVSSECSQKTAEADQLRAELQTEKSRIMQLGGVMQEAAVLLRHILTDSEKPQWKIPRLLEILESTAPRGTDSTPGDPTEKSSRGQKPQTSGPRPARTLCRQKTSSSVSPAPQGQEPPAEPDPVNRKKDECSSSCRSISK
ncbi:cingulin-like [Toxotes jaculatrix]|uniref:cingulin-like n=1 Tax=Toxotes jaculatrix TaxID=941984 RepID=UPI001B3AC48F|nr:cingulin-like [Toxotes jaculatrix]